MSRTEVPILIRANHVKSRSMELEHRSATQLGFPMFPAFMYGYSSLATVLEPLQRSSNAMMHQCSNSVPGWEMETYRKPRSSILLYLALGLETLLLVVWDITVPATRESR